MTIPMPPSMGWGSARVNRLVEIQTADLGEMRYTAEVFADSKLDVRITGESARRIIEAMDPNIPVSAPYLPAGSAPINHQDEALAAARRDLNEANRRAAASRQLAVELEESLMDYEGEINALRQELGLDPKPADGWMKKLSAGGYIDPKSTILAVDPGLPSATAPIIEYSKADIEITTGMMRGLASKQQDQYSLARIHNEKYTLEGE
ncbi:hypothetical protein SEA_PAULODIABOLI_230 [Microbacterium phage PauloDiaboli]|nr:hypothetical protein SEA_PAULODIABOLI_230 [Microbacterium phage PauloDiaboli]